MSKGNGEVFRTTEFGLLANLSKVQIMPGFNVRQDTVPDEELIESVRETGIVNPVHVRWQDREEKALWVVDGERRVRAAQVAGLDQIPVVQQGHISDKDALILSLTANENQKSLSIREKSVGFKKLKELGLQPEEIARVMGTTIRDVREILRLIDKASPKMREAALHVESIPTRVASRAATLPRRVQTDLVQKLRGRSVREGLTAVRNVEKELGIKAPTAPKEPYVLAPDFRKRCEELEKVIRFEMKQKPKSKTLQAQMLVIAVLKGQKEILEIFPDYRAKNP